MRGFGGKKNKMKVNILEDQPNGLKKGPKDLPEALANKLIAKGIAEKFTPKKKKKDGE